MRIQFRNVDLTDQLALGLIQVVFAETFIELIHIDGSRVTVFVIRFHRSMLTKRIGTVSADGDALTMFPAIVPFLRICAEAT